jgi:hypothetical protein
LLRSAASFLFTRQVGAGGGPKLIAARAKRVLRKFYRKFSMNKHAYGNFRKACLKIVKSKHALYGTNKSML